MPLAIVDEYRESTFARNHTGLLLNLPVPPPEREQLPVGISLCMIVKNEERFLAECLASVRDVVDELNVVDTGSTDRTVEIAREFGANVIFREWRNDFAWARNQALEMATRRWTLVLDADEEITPDSLATLRALRETPADYTAVYLKIENLVDDETGAGSTMSHILPRIFPTTPRIRYHGVIHENVVLHGADHLPGIVSTVRVLHKGYTKEILGSREKGLRNKPLLERAIRENGDDAFSWYNFGVNAVVAGDIGVGIEALEKVFAMETTVRGFIWTAYVMLATAYAEGRGEIDRGIELLDRGLAGSPNHPNLLFTRGYLLALGKRYEEARESYRRSMHLGAGARAYFMVDDEIASWKASLNIASTYVKEDNWEEALPWYERAFASKPDSPLLRSTTAHAYESVGRVYDAERLFREGAQIDGSTGFVNYANFLIRRRRFDEAFEMIDRRSDIVGARARATLLLSAAKVLRDEALGDPLPYAERALALAPGDGRILGLIDELCLRRGDQERRARLRAEELDAPLVMVGDFARRSHRLLEEKRPQDALAVAEDALTFAPLDPVLRFNAALAAARLHRDADALAHLAHVPDADGHAGAALALRAEIERRSNDLDAAVATVRRMRALPLADASTLKTTAVGLATDLLAAGRVADAQGIAALALD
ncbi:MAG TPA: glycosyltransferase [Candidatus Sulfotelmatobacter sp.]|nr:glycosyltransferase [Candidatus Sulfotelmatobacter sp.]